MEVIKNKVEDTLTVSVSGRVDTTTAPALEESIKEDIETVKRLELDLANLEYISSAGLRVLLSCQKIMSKQGEMVLKNVNEVVKDILEVTGFSDILTIE